MTSPKTPLHPFDLMKVEARLTEEQRAMQSVVRDYLTKNVNPHIGQWFEDGQIPARELAKDLGAIEIGRAHV